MKSILILIGLTAIIGCGNGPNDEILETPLGQLIALENGHETLWAGRQTCEYYTIRLRPETSDYAYLNAAIVEASQAWNTAMAYEFVQVRKGEEENPFNDAPESAVLIVPGHAPQYGPQPNGGILLELALSLKDYGPCACQVEVWDEAWTPKIIAHALGHCFGLSHSDLEESLMFKRAKDGNFTQEMVDLLKGNMKEPSQ